MKAGNTKNKETVISGSVIKKCFAKGTKSEHEAVYIETTGVSYKLKRMGGNPFNDATLEKWVGKDVTATGMVDGYQFIATSIVDS